MDKIDVDVDVDADVKVDEMKFYYDNHALTYWEDNDIYMSREGHDMFLFSENPTQHQFPTTTYFKVEKCREDELFVQRIGEAEVVSSKKHHQNKRTKYHHTRKFKESIANPSVARILSESDDCIRLFRMFREISVASNDFGFYHSCIIAAAYFIHLIYTEDSIYDLFPDDEITGQLNMLWVETISLVGKKNCSFDDLWKCVVKLTSNEQEYSALIQPEVDELVMCYDFCLNRVKDFGNNFKNPYSGLPKPEQESNSIVQDVENAMSKMGPPPSVTVDGYTRLLIMIANRNSFSAAVILYCEVLDKLIDTEALLKLDASKSVKFYDWTTEDIGLQVQTLMTVLSYPVQLKLRKQLLAVTRPLLKFHECDPILIHPNVFEVIEVAELRRRALGNRFISRNHFLWAFYECCYGLPPKIRDELKFYFEDESPPYHIYVTASQLAASFGEKKMELEHFVFAVLYSENTKVNEATEMQEHFRYFMEEVALDRMERPQETPRRGIVRAYLEATDCPEGVVMDKDAVASGSSF